MSKIDLYIHAATRKNTRRSYQSAIEHFEVTWGGFLPATADSVARYLADYADSLSVNTLKNRLSALAQWHIDQGFPDPAKAPVVKKVLKGIKELHPSKEHQAKPLQIEALNQVVCRIESAQSKALASKDINTVRRLSRNKALVLMGFWRGFRSDELSRLRIEHIQVVPNEGIHIYLPSSKSDRQNKGCWYKTPSLSRLCPVTSYTDWIHSADLNSGSVFRRIDRWGNISDRPLNSNSITPLLRNIFEEADLDNPDHFSSHSLRRGFASWANSNGWDVKSLMEYVGWRDMKSAMRYIDSVELYAKQKIEAAIGQQGKQYFPDHSISG